MNKKESNNLIAKMYQHRLLYGKILFTKKAKLKAK